jgi:N-acyl homoserine lactone hydrolase
MKYLAAIAALFLAGSAQAADAPGTVDKLWRLDCGRNHVADLNRFSDTRSYTGQSRDFVASCYLIKDGDAYMLWDAGYPAAMKGATKGPAIDKTIVEQLAELGIKPEQIGLIGISHHHGDHIGQAADFPKAKLVIGAVDMAIARNNEASAKALAPWIGQGASVEAITGDKDLFGDGAVTMLDLRGHTSSHHGLLVRLPKTGYVLLSGDVAHFRENLASDGVPTMNVDRADSLAAMDRFRKLAAALKAVAIIQHDPRDVAKLPKFPQGAE